MTSKFIGVTELKSNGTFIVKLSVNGVQTYVGTASTAEAAARLYDAALWKLLPFTTSRAKPNYPADFDRHAPEHVSELVNRIYAEASVALNAQGLDVNILREERDKQIARGGRVGRSVWMNRAVTAENFSQAVFKLNIRFKQQIAGTYSLAKVPELSKLRDKLTEDLRKLSVEMDVYASELKGHTEFLERMDSL